MAFTLASWNIEGRLSQYDGGKNRGTPGRILAEIKRLNADIVVLPEAYLNAPAKGVDEQLKALGYSWYDTKYNDTLHDEDIKRWGYPYMRVLYRLPLVHAKTRRWGNIRDLPVLTVRDPETAKEVTIIATHLDDLTEERRLEQASAIAVYLKTVSTPVVMAGDFNAMWRKGWQQLLTTRAANTAIKMIPQRKLNDVLTRLSKMATGRVMILLKEAGLREADQQLRSTTTPKMRSMPWMPSIRLAQIDHILFSPGITVTNPVIGTDRGSDHRSLFAKVK
jgi:endonuclease/exonuclease/phosphatase family metal-dependent hydrolase